MSLEKMLQVKNTFQRRIMCDNPDESGGAPLPMILSKHI